MFKGLQAEPRQAHLLRSSHLSGNELLPKKKSALMSLILSLFPLLLQLSAVPADFCSYDTAEHAIKTKSASGKGDRGH